MWRKIAERVGTVLFIGGFLVLFKLFIYDFGYCEMPWPELTTRYGHWMVGSFAGIVGGWTMMFLLGKEEE